MNLSELQVPEPTRDWIVTHSPEDYTTKAGDPFTVITIENPDTEEQHTVPLGRTDLRPLVDRDHVAVGDLVAIKFWGMSGQKFVYTFNVHSNGDKPEQEW